MRETEKFEAVQIPAHDLITPEFLQSLFDWSKRQLEYVVEAAFDGQGRFLRICGTNYQGKPGDYLLLMRGHYRPLSVLTEDQFLKCYESVSPTQPAGYISDIAAQVGVHKLKPDPNSPYSYIRCEYSIIADELARVFVSGLKHSKITGFELNADLRITGADQIRKFCQENKGPGAAGREEMKVVADLVELAVLAAQTKLAKLGKPVVSTGESSDQKPKFELDDLGDRVRVYCHGVSDSGVWFVEFAKTLLASLSGAERHSLLCKHLKEHGISLTLNWTPIIDLLHSAVPEPSRSGFVQSN